MLTPCSSSSNRFALFVSSLRSSSSNWSKVASCSNLLELALLVPSLLLDDRCLTLENFGLTFSLHTHHTSVPHFGRHLSDEKLAKIVRNESTVNRLCKVFWGFVQSPLPGALYCILGLCLRFFLFFFPSYISTQSTPSPAGPQGGGGISHA